MAAIYLDQTHEEILAHKIPLAHFSLCTVSFPTPTYHVSVLFHAYTTHTP